MTTTRQQNDWFMGLDENAWSLKNYQDDWKRENGSNCNKPISYQKSQMLFMWQLCKIFPGCKKTQPKKYSTIYLS